MRRLYLLPPKLALLVVAFGLFAAPLHAADMPLKMKASPFGNSYPMTKCGLYYGLGTGGSAGAIEGNVVGAQIVQGELDALIGYTCPFMTNAFWFAEGSVGFNNVNGNVNGLALSGPLVLMQRAGAGSPINALFNPFGNFLSLPSLPALPNGVTAGPANGYLFVGVVEQDITSQIPAAIGGGSSKQWLIAPLLGVGLLTRLSDGVVIDTWAGYQMNSQSFCPGGGSSCGKLGNAGRVGVSFKY